MQNIPPRFENCSIETIDPRVKKWIENKEVRQKEGLYLYGDCGTGKTHTAYAIYKNNIDQSKRCRLIKATETFKDIKDFYSYPERYDHNPLTTLLEWDGPLIIDDIGAEKASEWTIETLYILINKRYENVLPTIFTSNYSLEQLAERIGDRNTSRIAGMCEVIKLTGEDKRLNE